MPKQTNEFDRLLHEDHTGIRVWRNPKNGFVCFELHYTADPEKNTDAWRKNTFKGMNEKDVAVEYELKRLTYGGKPVYLGAYHRHIHKLSTIPKWNTGVPVGIRGWDFGGNQSCIVTQPVGTRLVVHHEFPNAGKNTRVFAPQVIAECNRLYGSEVHWIDVIDPTGRDEGKTSDGFSCEDVMIQFDLNPVLAITNDPEERINAVTQLLMTLNENDGKPNLLISPDCHMLLQGFEGGYQYPEKPTQAQRKDRPLKNKWSHIQDGLQYTALLMLSGGINHSFEDELMISVNQNLPNYSFNK